VEAGGFKRYVRDNVTVTAAATVRVDPVLELGALTESVEITGTLLTVQSENARVSTAVENKFVDELPLVVGGTLRNPYDLVQIAPQVLKRGADNVALGGASARAWNATLDGLSITTNRSAEAEVAFMAPSLEAITEFAVDTGGFKAEYGQASGGILTFSSKSGTNQLRGTLYEFLRNEKLDARAFFERQKSVYKQHDFGAAGGGPIVVPKLYNGRNRSFFYLTYEGFRNRVGANAIIQSVPTPEMYDGDFSYWVDRNNRLLQIYDPSTTRVNPSGGFLRDPFAGNRIPKSRFSQFTQKVIPYAQGVKPNRGGQPGTLDYVRNNFIVTSGTILEPQDKGSAKIDHMLTDKHRFGFFMNLTSYRREIGAGGPPGLPVPLYTGEVQTFDTRAYRLTHDWMISSTLLNQFQIGGNLFAKVSFSPNYGKGWKDKLCFANVVDCNRNFPTVGFSEFSSWGGNARNGTEQPMWSLKDDFNYTRGRHAFKMGFTYQDQTAVGFGEQSIAGSASFNFLGTSVPGNTTFTSGSSFASFLLGDAQSGNTETVRDIGQIYPYYGFYAQDDWRLSKRLTLNLGVRYDFTLPPREALDQFSDFTPNRPNPAVNNFPGALRFAGFGPGRENRRSLVPGWYKGIGPRFGLAYSLGPKTTLRTAFGRSFSRVTVSRGSGHYAGFIGSYGFSSLDSGITPAFNWDKGLPYYPLPITMDPKAELNPAFSNNQSVSYWLPTDAARASENFYWTFNLQREIAPNTVLEVGYSATIGVHLMAYLQILNQLPTAVWNSYVQKYGPTGARDLLRSDINSRAARDANVPIPYPNFTDAKVQNIRTVAQALRPYPQFTGISTGGDGDKSGHSSYHSLIVKASRRYSNGLAFEWNYVLSKLLADSDNFYDDATTQDQYNRRLEKSIGEFDQTHALKFSTVYELPFGRDRRFLASSHGLVQALLGGWRVSAIQMYARGFPVRLTRNNPLPISNNDTRPVITSYDNWRAPLGGEKFDPAVDRFMNRDVFPAQPIGFGNATRYNPKLRSFPTRNENIGLAKRFSITERFQLDFRWEAFNLFNRTTFGTGGGNLDSSSFGIVTSQENDPRRMQAGLKLYW
jgi:outer membrane receptor protein involved in Fe transport